MDKNKTNLQTFLSNKKYIFWYVKDLNNLSNEAIVEGIIKYGTWEDLKFVLNLDFFKDSYKAITTKKRCNLSKIEINFINKLLENV